MHVVPGDGPYVSLSCYVNNNLCCSNRPSVRHGEVRTCRRICGRIIVGLVEDRSYSRKDELVVSKRTNGDNLPADIREGMLKTLCVHSVFSITPDNKSTNIGRREQAYILAVPTPVRYSAKTLDKLEGRIEYVNEEHLARDGSGGVCYVSRFGGGS